MKIAHIAASGPYTEDMTYQENILPLCQKEQGHEVTVIANCICWNESKLGSVAPMSKTMASGVQLVRLPYFNIVNAYITEKLRYIKGLYTTLEKIKPDFIFLHDVSTGAVTQLKKYLDAHPETILVADSHTTFSNSGRVWISRKVLHGIIYRYFANKIYPYIRTIYYITPDARRFLTDIYKLPEDKLAFLPLGGIILKEDIYKDKRTSVRRKYNISDNVVVFLHSGKLDSGKRTIELINAFASRKNRSNTELYIIGDTDDAVRKNKIKELAEMDNTVHFLGWKTGEELFDFLCATDIYVQPGVVSATLQLAACNRCGVVVKQCDGYSELLKNAGIVYSEDDKLPSIIDDLCGNIENVVKLKNDTFSVARTILDYDRQSRMILYEDGIGKIKSI